MMLIRVSMMICLISGVINLRSIFYLEADFSTCIFLALDIAFIYAFTAITKLME